MVAFSLGKRKLIWTSPLGGGIGTLTAWARAQVETRSKGRRRMAKLHRLQDVAGAADEYETFRGPGEYWRCSHAGSRTISVSVRTDRANVAGARAVVSGRVAADGTPLGAGARVAADADAAVRADVGVIEAHVGLVVAVTVPHELVGGVDSVDPEV